MSIDDDVVLLERVPTLRLLGGEALRVLAIGAEQQQFARGSILFRAGDEADAGYVVQEGGFRIHLMDGSDHEVIAERGALIGELALIVPMARPATAVALEYSMVIRIPRTLFLRVLDSDPAAARRLRDELSNRTRQTTSDILVASARLNS
ncbi:cyclic nucleotide-binding domain-containing protein [Nitrobacter sp.]|uniref:cyclic nucleotide-binding domain-containing protein n=1 Tax=Nitrobacter sp. TaxID=29420 RepID=UPI003F64AEB2